MTADLHRAFLHHNRQVVRARLAYAAEPFALSKLAATQWLNGLSQRMDPRVLQLMRDEVRSW